MHNCRCASSYLAVLPHPQQFSLLGASGIMRKDKGLSASDDKRLDPHDNLRVDDIGKDKESETLHSGLNFERKPVLHQCGSNEIQKAPGEGRTLN
ncbi:hypothetical protein PMIN05_005279 [Paraphaeosphaeria minitans]